MFEVTQLLAARVANTVTMRCPAGLRGPDPQGRVQPAGLVQQML